MRRIMQLLAVTCTVLFIVSAATPADAKKKWWHSGGPSEEWASGRVSFNGMCEFAPVPTVPPAPAAVPGVLDLGMLPGRFRLTDIVIGNPGTSPVVVGIGEGGPPPVTRLTVVVPGGMTFTDTFRIALVFAQGPLIVTCPTNDVYITVSGKLHNEHDDDD
jgi:hypothetical protein